VKLKIDRSGVGIGYGNFEGTKTYLGVLRIIDGEIFVFRSGKYMTLAKLEAAADSLWEDQDTNWNNYFKEKGWDPNDDSKFSKDFRGGLLGSTPSDYARAKEVIYGLAMEAILWNAMAATNVAGSAFSVDAFKSFASKASKCGGPAFVSGSKKMDAYRATMGPIADVERIVPALGQREGTDVCVARVLQQAIGKDPRSKPVIDSIERIATSQGGYDIKDAATNLVKSKVCPEAQYKQAITLAELETEASKGTVMLSVTNGDGGRHAVGVTYDKASGWFFVHDPLAQAIYPQTGASLMARTKGSASGLGAAVIGIR
jgi:hypothetical protein